MIKDLIEMNEMIIIGFLISAVVLICFLIVAYIVWLYGSKEIRKDIEKLGESINKMLEELKNFKWGEK